MEISVFLPLRTHPYYVICNINQNVRHIEIQGGIVLKSRNSMERKAHARKLTWS